MEVPRPGLCHLRCKESCDHEDRHHQGCHYWLEVPGPPLRRLRGQARRRPDSDQVGLPIPQLLDLPGQEGRGGKPTAEPRAGVNRVN